MIEQLVPVLQKVSKTAQKSLSEIERVTAATRILSINAMIEAAGAGEKGRGFAVVASEVAKVSKTINSIADTLGVELSQQLAEVDRLGREFGQSMRGLRLAELSLNMIEIIDRNLYERSCDVRWWATDSAVVNCAQQPDEATRSYASKRLGVILDSYTVYLDIWILDLQGNVLASGRPNLYPGVQNHNHKSARWFAQAAATRDGTEFAVADIDVEPSLAGRSVATYATAIRADGQTSGAPIGVLAILFDWQTQAHTVVNSVHLSADEKTRSRCLIVDSDQRVIAASDGMGLLQEIFPLRIGNRALGSYTGANDTLIGYALTPGYETYKGLGWYGVVVQKAAEMIVGAK